MIVPEKMGFLDGGQKNKNWKKIPDMIVPEKMGFLDGGQKN